MKSDKPHHHGNLRQALIDAGLELLSQGDLTALTIRGVAARAGVSHAAPAHHFRNLAELRSAVVAHGFDEFAAMMRAVRDSANGTDRDNVIAISVGYLKFAQAHPALFQMMFVKTPLIYDDDVINAAAQASYEVLRETCAPIGAETGDPLAVELQVWSFIHGYAHLAIAQQIAHRTDEDAVTLLRRIFPTF